MQSNIFQKSNSAKSSIKIEKMKELYFFGSLILFGVLIELFLIYQYYKPHHNFIDLTNSAISYFPQFGGLKKALTVLPAGPHLAWVSVLAYWPMMLVGFMVLYGAHHFNKMHIPSSILRRFVGIFLAAILLFLAHYFGYWTGFYNLRLSPMHPIMAGVLAFNIGIFTSAIFFIIKSFVK
jgi:hypothetical protein